VNEITRAVVIIGVVGVGLAVVAAWTAYADISRRSAIRTGSLRPWPAVVFFTSTDCDACDPVRKVVFGRAPRDVIREIAYQGGADQFRSAGVEKVPAVVVLDGRGRAVGLFEGQVTRRQIGRALRRAGIG